MLTFDVQRALIRLPLDVFFIERTKGVAMWLAKTDCWRIMMTRTG